MDQSRNPECRAILSEQPDTLRIEIPVDGGWALYFTGGFFCFWVFVQLVIAVGALAYWSTEGIAFLILSLCASVPVLAVLSHYWCWYMNGRQFVILDRHGLTVGNDLTGKGSQRRFDLARIRNLRADPEYYNPRNDWVPFGCGDVAFDHGTQEFRFGSNLGRAEAERIVEAIKCRLPLLEVQKLD